jgi:hypothetical protein
MAQPARDADYRRKAARFIVREATGQTLAYVHFEGEQSQRAAAKLLSRDEARRIAANIAKLRELLRGRPTARGGVRPPASAAHLLARDEARRITT